MLASHAHMYMPQLFTHCLPTIICVMLMSIMSFLMNAIALVFCVFKLCHVWRFTTESFNSCDINCSGLCVWARLY